MRIALLCPFLPMTGNTSTALRIESHLQSGGIEVHRFETGEHRSVDDFLAFVEAKRIEAAIGLHGFKSGLYLECLTKPYILLFTNTDLNVDFQNPERRSIMQRAAEGAAAVVTYNEEFQARLKELWPSCRNVRCIHKGVVVAPDPHFSIREHCGLASDSILFLLPAGLRAIKDPAFALPAFSKFHKRVRGVHLVICGVMRSEKYAQDLLSLIDTIPGVHYAGAIPTGQVQQAMCDSVAVLNTSVHEEEPNAPLEALALGVPVIARRIPGNESYLVHGHNGFLVDTPQEIVAAFERLLNEPALRSQLSEGAKKFIELNRSLDRERKSYLEIVKTLL